MTRDELKAQHDSLVAYLLAKVKAADWHAVQDAASDIREVNAKLDVLDHLGIDGDMFDIDTRRMSARR